MIAASELRAGAVLRIGDELFGVEAAEYHAGGGQQGAAVFAKTRGLRTRHLKEMRFHPGDKLDDVELDRRNMEFLYCDGSDFYFMDPDTFEQIALSEDVIGTGRKYLQPNMRIPVRLYEGAPVTIDFPESVELKVTSAPPGLRDRDTSAHKRVILENGEEMLAPQFIKEGDIVKIEVATGRYLERLRR